MLDLPKCYQSETTLQPTGHGNAYIVVGLNDDNYPIHVSCHMGSTSPCDKANAVGVTTIVNILLLNRVDPKQILAHLIGIQCCPVVGRAKSIPDAIGRVLQQHFPSTTAESKSSS